MRTLSALLCACSLLASPLRAQNAPVVVELFTSQGCSSCPPADRYLRDLDARDGIIALALHVDYWDYIGWRDSFGSPAWSARQRSYAAAGGRNWVYTPQMIINGVDEATGTRTEDVEGLIAKHGAQDPAMQLRVKRTDGTVEVRGSAAAGHAGPFDVELVHFIPVQRVQITRGENAGRTLIYTNIVTRIETLATWDGRGPLAIDAPMKEGQSGVIMIQTAETGRIISARRIR